MDEVIRIVGWFLFLLFGLTALMTVVLGLQIAIWIFG